MATFTVPKTRRIIPIKSNREQMHPRVLVEERECCSCTHFEITDLLTTTQRGYCNFHNHPMGWYDECSAFDKAKESAR